MKRLLCSFLLFLAFIYIFYYDNQEGEEQLINKELVSQVVEPLNSPPILSPGVNKDLKQLLPVEALREKIEQKNFITEDHIQIPKELQEALYPVIAGDENATEATINVVSEDVAILEAQYDSQGGGDKVSFDLNPIPEFDPSYEILEVNLPPSETTVIVLPDDTAYLEEEYDNDRAVLIDVNMHQDPDAGNFIDPLEYGDEPASELTVPDPSIN